MRPCPGTVRGRTLYCIRSDTTLVSSCFEKVTMRCVGVCFMIQVEGTGAGSGSVSVTESGHNSSFSSHLVSIAAQDRCGISYRIR